MPTTNIHPPFEAYKGDAPFIFVSYAHKDAELVFPDLEKLRGYNFRLWFDEEIDPGNEWPEEVARALSNSSMFLVFISSNAVASRNVRNEIHFALNNSKPFLAVYVEQTALPKGLELRMGDIQAILKYRMDPNSYWRKLEKVLPEGLKGTEARMSVPAPNAPTAVVPPASIGKSPLKARISYDLPTGQTIENLELPFIVGVIADLSGTSEIDRPSLRDRVWREINCDNFESILGVVQPSMRASVSDSTAPDGQTLIEVRFSTLNDFSPEALVRNIRRSANELGDADLLSSSLVNQIVNLADYERLEATWRGLFFLVSESARSSCTKVFVFDAKTAELREDFDTNANLFDTALFKNSVTNIFQRVGDVPFGLFVGDFEFGSSEEDIRLLRSFSLLAAAAHAPFISAAAPSLFGLNSIRELGELSSISNQLSGHSPSWEELRDSEESCFIGMALPKFNLSCFGFNSTKDDRISKPVWGSPAYAFVARVFASFAKHRWFATIKGVQNGSIRQDVSTLDGRTSIVEMSIDGRLEGQLTNAGFIPLCTLPDASGACFFSANSVRNPFSRSSNQSPLAARLLSQLSYTLACCRFIT